MHMMKTISLTLLAVLFVACATESGGAPEPPALPETRLESVSTALLMGDPEKAVAAHEKAFKDAPQTAATRILHARLLILTLRLDEAKREVDAVLAQEPSNPDALFARALIAASVGDKKAQKGLLQKVIAVDQAHAEALVSLGSLYLEEREYAKARECFLKAQSLEGESLATSVGLGNVSFKEKKYDEARKHFDRAVVLDPKYPFAYSDRALVRRQLGDTAGALEDLDTAVMLDPDYPYNYYDRGRILMSLDKWPEAVAQFTLAIERDPGMFIAYVMRAGLHDDMNQIDLAIADYRMAIKLRKDYFFSYACLGTLAWMKDDPAQAFAMYETAFRYEPNVPEYALLAALALKKAGRGKEAAAWLGERLPQIPRTGWQYNTAQFFITPEYDYAAVNDANHEKNKVNRARMLFYLGEQFLLLNKNALAQTYLEEAAGVERRGLIEKRLARFDLQKLSAK